MDNLILISKLTDKVNKMVDEIDRTTDCVRMLTDTIIIIYDDMAKLTGNSSVLDKAGKLREIMEKYKK